MFNYLDEVDTLDDVDIDDDVDTELEVDTLKIKENRYFKTNWYRYKIKTALENLQGLSCNMDLSFFEDCGKQNVLFNSEVFSLIKLRQVSNLV